MTFPPVQRDSLKWAAVDLDGTLATDVWPDPGIGEPIRVNVLKVRELVKSGWKIVIHTARGWESYETIEAWLHHNGVPFSRIVCGKLLAGIYVDDRNVDPREASWVPIPAVTARDRLAKTGRGYCD